MRAEIQGGRAALRNLGSKLDEEALKQQEILTHRYVIYPYGDLEGWLIKVKVVEYGSGLSVYPLH